jgi:hypothetical protein
VPGSKFCEKSGKYDFYSILTKVLIGKSLQLEKTDTAKSKNKSAKAFAPRQGPAHLRRAL